MSERTEAAIANSESPRVPRLRVPASWKELSQILQQQIVFILLFGLVIVASMLSDVFLTKDNLLNILQAISVLGIVALGQTVLLITGNFDMSVSMVVPFTGMLAIGVQRMGGSLELSLAAGLAGGLLIGLINGTIVVKTRANPFLVTIGMQSLVYALSLIITEAKTWYATIPEYNIVGRGRLFGDIPYSVLLFLGAALALELFFRRTIWGKYLFALGYNEEATVLSGVNEADQTCRIHILRLLRCCGWHCDVFPAEQHQRERRRGNGV
jgi:ribose/xylose/arabinose/galactoside ABC-type transport system permease subunit